MWADPSPHCQHEPARPVLPHPSRVTPAHGTGSSMSLTTKGIHVLARLVTHWLVLAVALAVVAGLLARFQMFGLTLLEMRRLPD